MSAIHAPTILLVDDDLDILDALGGLLKDEGYNVVTAVNGREALDRLHERLPQVILLDLMMPVMDGWQVHRQVRLLEHLRDIPILVMSADRTAQRQAMELGADGYISKPFDLDDLLNRLRQMILLSGPHLQPAPSPLL